MTAPMSLPPEPRNLTIGMQVDAAFRLLDVLPFQVRYDISRLIYLYLHDPGSYLVSRTSILGPTAVPEEPPPP